MSAITNDPCKREISELNAKVDYYKEELTKAHILIEYMIEQLIDYFNKKDKE